MATIRWQGDVNIYTAAQIKQELLSQLPDEGELVLELDDVCDFDSAGAQLVVLARREMENRGGALSMRNISRPVHEVLELYGICKAEED